ncbi:MAG: CRISPR-associated endonuclease Cas2 [Endomicrobium sp.]|jgi:CRISPR-associated protein Cas2|nr:CRISPR-associated endonuclease Cas2 [Endomicrobium sp.]
MEELITLVFYDVRKNKIRAKVAEKCKDYGLSRFQYTGFSGKLSKRKREDLKHALENIIGDNKARLIVQAVCTRCLSEVFITDNMSEKEEKPKKSEIYFGMKMNRAYLNSEDIE